MRSTHSLCSLNERFSFPPRKAAIPSKALEQITAGAFSFKHSSATSYLVFTSSIKSPCLVSFDYLYPCDWASVVFVLIYRTLIRTKAIRTYFYATNFTVFWKFGNTKHHSSILE